MKHLFIDSQIWLSLYDFSNDDLEQFRKLNDIIDTEVKIYLTQQVKEEIERNRENKIKSAKQNFKEINNAFPNLFKGYKEYNELVKIRIKYNKKLKDLLNQVDSDIEMQTLHADKVIKEIFSKLVIIRRTEKIINKAIIRYNIGNPPGKDRSYGDAINWEMLLQGVSENEDLYFISADKDFKSVINANRLNPYLSKEWKNKKNTDIFFYKSLTEFFINHMKDIELKNENEKNILIEKLKNSDSFQKTHNLINKMQGYTSWTNEQIKSLIELSFNNSQVYFIIKDEDIVSFYRNILKDRTKNFTDVNELEWLLSKIE